MKVGEILGALFWLGIGILLTVWSTHYDLGTVTEPGPAFLPIGLGALLILLSLVLLTKTLMARPTGKEASSFSATGWAKVGYATIVMALAAFFLEEVGYLITFFFLVVLLMMVAGRRSWIKILAVACVTDLVLYVVFVWLLQQQLPSGFLGY